MKTEKGWVLTDDSCAQHRKQTDAQSFRFVEITAKQEDAATVQVREAAVNLGDVSEADMSRVLTRYNKKPLEVFRRQNGESANRLIAEYLFEERVGVPLGDKDFPTEDAAREFLQHYTQENLDEGGSYKDYGLFKSGDYKTCYTREAPESVEDCLTRRDFLELCGGDALKADIVFGLCDWQYPSTILAAWDEEDEAALRKLKEAARMQ